jgi:hypothetical protein
MSDVPYSLTFIEGVIREFAAKASLVETEGPDGGPYLPLTQSESPSDTAGYARLWCAEGASPLDRMVHMRLIAGPVETQLLFVFGRADTCMPHLHLQVVEFPPDGCVYNVDLMPRLDAVDFPEWYTRVYSGLRRSYRQATGDRSNSCAQAPANPALAVYMSPWGIASGRANRAELDRVAPQLLDYVSHYLKLAEEDWPPPEGVDTAERDQRYLELFFADELDPRAWHGVYKVVGEARGRVIKSLLRTPQRIPSNKNS